MFHVELRQFPHQARAFNLTREELDAKILRAWAAGVAVEYDDRRWPPDRAKLTIYEGPALRPDEMGLGRGWANVTRSGSDVTERLLADPGEGSSVEELKRAILAACEGGAIALGQLVDLAGADRAGSRASERLERAEQAVWELLHQGRVSLLRHGAPVAREQWQPALLAWASWIDAGAGGVFVAAGRVGDFGK